MLTELFLRGRLRHELGDAEKDALENAVSGTRTLEPRTSLVERGERLESSYYLIEGTMLRLLDDRKGERQLLGVSVPGDFVDLHGFAMKRLDHDVASLTKAVLAEVPHRELRKLIEDFPHLARILWFSTLLDAAMHREWIFRLGRLSAEGRIAHLICELIERLRFVGMFDGTRFPIPLLQRDYAEACGITPVHANRSFRSLRERGYLDPHAAGRLDILDEEGLKNLAEFRSDYLYGKGELAIDELRDR